MKKTIIAAAVAAVAATPAAFADVSISGNVVSEIVDNTNGDLGSATAGTKVGSQNAVDIVFKASEDLGNGMKASAVVHMLEDNGSDGNADATVALSGDFGTIKMGRMEPFIEGQVVSQASFDASDALSIENAQQSSKRSEGGVRYTNSMGAFSFGVEAFSTEEGTDATGDDFSMTAVMAKYSANGLTVTVANENRSTTASGSAKGDTTAIAVNYKMGDMSFTVVNQDSDQAAKDDTVYGMTYKMGNNTFGIGKRSSDAANEDDGIISVKHSLSKNTWVGLTHLMDDSASVDDRTALTLGMKF